VNSAVTAEVWCVLLPLLLLLEPLLPLPLLLLLLCVCVCV
jgi:hypothetical protein